MNNNIGIKSVKIVSVPKCGKDKNSLFQFVYVYEESNKQKTGMQNNVYY